MRQFARLLLIPLLLSAFVVFQHAVQHAVQENKLVLILRNNFFYLASVYVFDPRTLKSCKEFVNLKLGDQE